MLIVKKKKISFYTYFKSICHPSSTYFGAYTVRIKIKVIHIQRPIVLKSNDLKICMWHIGEEQLILFLLVPFLHQVCHA